LASSDSYSAGVVGHVAGAVGGAADEIKCIFCLGGVEDADVQVVHQLDFDVAHQVGAIHLDRLRHVVGGAGHGADEDLSFMCSDHPEPKGG
jgi:hypothetical protein